MQNLIDILQQDVIEELMDEAVIKGDLNKIKQIHENTKKIHRSMYILNIAAAKGHLEIVNIFMIMAIKQQHMQ